jgi:hypothetical protein
MNNRANMFDYMVAHDAAEKPIDARKKQRRDE